MEIGRSPRRTLSLSSVQRASVMDHSEYSLSDMELQDQAQSLNEGDRLVESATDVSSIVSNR